MRRCATPVCIDHLLVDTPGASPQPDAGKLGSPLTRYREVWQDGRMARVKTTLSIDESLMRQVRIRAARSNKSQSEVLEAALREGLGIIERIRAKARLSDEEAIDIASKAVHEVRAQDQRERKP
ncbi:MAG: ribbon-helix-helix protein, CopG family [Actinobacteria bacterium]|nr:ribbon-helix-helix protein, CopG family [Actinomycetota bacterium]